MLFRAQGLDCFQYPVWVATIHYNGHFSVAVITNVGMTQQGPPILYHLDSLKGANCQWVCRPDTCEADLLLQTEFWVRKCICIPTTDAHVLYRDPQHRIHCQAIIASTAGAMERTGGSVFFPLAPWISTYHDVCHHAMLRLTHSLLHALRYWQSTGSSKGRTAAAVFTPDGAHASSATLNSKPMLHVQEASLAAPHYYFAQIT